MTEDDTSTADHPGSPPAAAVVMVAAQLHVADLIVQDGALQRVTSLRLQGAPPTVSVALTGVPGRRSFPPDARLRVVRSR